MDSHGYLWRDLDTEAIPPIYIPNIQEQHLMHQTFFSESTLKKAKSLSTSLVMSQTRIAPAKKITLARLELINGYCYHCSPLHLCPRSH